MKTINFFNPFILKIYYLISFVFLSQTLIAQNDNYQPYQTVFRNNNGHSRISGFGSLINELSLPNSGKIGLMYSVGAEAAVLFKQRFYLGGYSLVSVAPNDLERTFNDQEDLRFLQIGGIIGYKFSPNRPIHFNLGAKVGYAGAIWYDNRYGRYDNYNAVTKQVDNWMISPQAKIEINFFSWMQVNAGVGYRWVIGEKQFDLDPRKDFSQATINAGISFGYFK